MNDIALGWRCKKIGVIKLKSGERMFGGKLTQEFIGFLGLLTSTILPADPLLRYFFQEDWGRSYWFEKMFTTK